ncbi:MAG: hypothetical protein QOE51_2480 [Actinoplanes sp.]|jgi:hypothetical protein|nr:hypothetical protein [Pseudonocardiales bacterium]MDT5041495.1 hypothetical protein [Actinoplanes sp.]
MTVGSRRSPVVVVSLVSLVSAAAFVAGIPNAYAAGQVSLTGTGTPVTGAAPPSGTGLAVQDEFADGPVDGQSPAAYPGVITDRALSSGTGHGVSVTGNKPAKSTPTFTTGFEGLNLYQQRYARRGNQFTVEPPDQALCVGNGYELEAVNDVLNVFDASGHSTLPDNTAANVVSGFPRDVNHAVDLNSFYGYGPAINRATGQRAQNITDPTCLYDAATQRFFLVVLTLDTNPNGSLNLVNHLDLAVSQTSNPNGNWNIYKVDVTNDGSNPSPANACPCLGDYPHIGADANGIYLTTNSYPWNGTGFDGAQIYALSKAQLAAGSPNVNVVHIDTFGAVNQPSDAGSTQPGFTVWPAHSPGTTSYDANAGGTEYLLSSNAADEATHPVAGTGGNYVSSQIVTWALTNTSSLNTATPNLQLTNKVLASNTYAIPPKQHQAGAGTAPGSGVPQGHCINDTTTTLFNGQTGCWRLVFGVEPAHDEVISTPDSNDTRMQQVMYANGKIWGALDTALNPASAGQRAGIAWFIVKPDTSSGSLAAKIALQGYLGAVGADFTYPTIGVTPSGRGVMGFTYSGDTAYPSAAYAPIDAVAGTGAWSVVPGGAGQAADDGFTSYKAQVGNPPRTRWGDYGAAAVDGNHVWIASEYIGHSCDYAAWGGPFFAGGSGDNLLGTCGGANHGPGVRTALGNWSTRISEFTP